MRKLALLGLAGLIAVVPTSVALAGGAPTPGPIDPGPGEDPDPTDPGTPADPGTPSDPGTPGGSGGSGGGTGGGTTAPAPMLVGNGSVKFNLDSLPTGPSGTQAFYQPFQDNSALDLPNNESAQGVLDQTVGGVTVSLRTADWVAGGSAPQTRIQTENMSSNFGYLNAPAANQITVGLTTFSAELPTALYANFSDSISYFSVEAIRLVGTFDRAFTFTAYSGQNGTGVALGTISGTVGGAPANFKSALFELTGLNGARSVAFLTDSNAARFDNISINRFAVGDVPEPATWGMMLLGFGMVGAAVRRRRTAVAA